MSESKDKVCDRCGGKVGADMKYYLCAECDKWLRENYPVEYAMGEQEGQDG